MSINVNTEDYQMAQELLDTSKSLFATTSDEISSVMNTLDGQVLSYVRADLALARSTMNTMQEDEQVISQDISTEVATIQQIEAKAAEQANEIASTATATGATQAAPAQPTGNKNTWAQGKEALSALGDLALSAGKGVLEVGASLVTGTFSLLTGNLGGLFDSCKSIFNAAVDIGKKAFSFVKESLEFIGHAFLSTAASIANLVMSLVEGILSFVEAIVDAAAMIVGVAASLFTGLYDGINWIGSKIFGYEFKSATKAMWTKGFLPFIGTDWTDKAFDAIYTVPPFTWMEEKAFGPFKREGGVVYKIGKGVGYTVGIVLATIFTCGVAGGGAAAASAAGGAAGAASGLSATTVSTVFAGLGGMGKGTQKGYQKAVKGLEEGEELSGGDVFKILGYGAANGAIEAGAWYFTFGKGKGTFLKNPSINSALGKSANGLNKVFGLSKDSSFMFKALNMEKALVQVGKVYASSSNDYVFLSDDVSVSGYVNNVLLSEENFTNAAIAGGVSLLYDATAGNYLKTQLEGKAKVDAEGNPIGKDGILTKWMNKLKTSDTKPTTEGESYLPGMDGNNSGAASAQDAITSSGLGAQMKLATVDVLESGGASKVYNNLPKKFFDYRNILELFPSGE